MAKNYGDHRESDEVASAGTVKFSFCSLGTRPCPARGCSGRCLYSVAFVGIARELCTIDKPPFHSSRNADTSARAQLVLACRALLDCDVA